MFDVEVAGSEGVGAGAGDVGEVLEVLGAAAGEALGAAARVGPESVGEAGLRGLVTGLERVRRALDAAQLHALGVLHERVLAAGGVSRSTGLATSRWLAREAGLPAGVARRRVETALQLREVLGVVDEALVEGRIGFDHAAVFASACNERNAEAFAEMVPGLIDAAALMAFARWRRDVEAVAELLDADGGHDPGGDLARNRLDLSPSDGLLLVRGELAGDLAVVFERAVQDRTDELFRRYSAEREQFPDMVVPGRATLRALALMELVRDGLGVDPEASSGPRTEAEIVVHLDDAPDDPATPPETGLTPEASGAVVTTPEGVRLPEWVADLFCCAVRFRVLTATPGGVPAAVSDAHDPTRAQRRGLARRDGGCVFPGCGSPVRWADAHHVVAWPTGPTVLSNLVLLCRRHHRCAHTGWRLVLDEDGWTRWTSPEGTTRWGQRHHTQRAGPTRAGP